MEAVDKGGESACGPQSDVETAVVSVWTDRGKSLQGEALFGKRAGNGESCTGNPQVVDRLLWKEEEARV